MERGDGGGVSNRSILPPGAGGVFFPPPALRGFGKRVRGGEEGENVMDEIKMSNSYDSVSQIVLGDAPISTLQ